MGYANAFFVKQGCCYSVEPVISLTVKDLLHYTLSQSDNNASNLMFKRLVDVALLLLTVTVSVLFMITATPISLGYCDVILVIVSARISGYRAGVPFFSTDLYNDKPETATKQTNEAKIIFLIMLFN